MKDIVPKSLLYVCLFFFLFGCSLEGKQSGFNFNSFPLESDFEYTSESVVSSTDSIVSYASGGDFSDVVSKELMSNVRETFSRSFVSNGFHGLHLLDDQTITEVTHLEGTRFAGGSRISTNWNPLVGMHLRRRRADEGWGDFSLEGGGDVESVAAFLEKLNSEFRLDKDFYPKRRVEVGESWTGTNYASVVRSPSAIMTYHATLLGVSLYDGDSVAKVGVTTRVIDKGGRVRIDSEGYTLYSLKRGMDIYSEMSGSMSSYSDHFVDGKVMRRSVRGNVDVINRIEFPSQNPEH